MSEDLQKHSKVIWENKQRISEDKWNLSYLLCYSLHIPILCGNLLSDINTKNLNFIKTITINAIHLENTNGKYYNYFLVFLPIDLDKDTLIVIHNLNNVLVRGFHKDKTLCMDEFKNLCDGATENDLPKVEKAYNELKKYFHLHKDM